mgnify:CR=1 FL=1
MILILDANVLFRTLISPGNILNLYFDSKIELYAPERLKQEFENNKNEIIEKSRLDAKEFEELSLLLFSVVTFVPVEKYKLYLQEAKTILKEHQKDEDFIALCLYYNAKLWTYEKRLIALGHGITTLEIIKLLQL